MAEFPEIEQLKEWSWGHAQLDDGNRWVRLPFAEQAVRDAVERNERQAVEARMESGRDEFIRREAIRECAEALRAEAGHAFARGQSAKRTAYRDAANFLLTLLDGEGA